MHDFGERLEDGVRVQLDEMGCMPGVLGNIAERMGVCDENTIEHFTQLLTEMGIFNETGFDFPIVEQMQHALADSGLHLSCLYGAQELSKTSEGTLNERSERLVGALDQGDFVIAAFPRRRPGSEYYQHFLHYVGLFKDESDGKYKKIDTSEVDGGLEEFGLDELLEIITPSDHIPVQAIRVSKTHHQKLTETQQQDTEWDKFPPGTELLTNPYGSVTDTGLQVPPRTVNPTSVVIASRADQERFASPEHLTAHLGVLSREGKYPNGYPRFVVDPSVMRLADTIGMSGFLPFSTREDAVPALELNRRMDVDPKIHEVSGVIWIENTPETATAWQHAGTGISARRALAIGEGTQDEPEKKRAAIDTIKAKISEHTGASFEDIFILPTGMSAIYSVNKILQSIDDRPAVQFGFPYVDSYEQRKFGHRMMSKNMIGILDSDYAAIPQELRALHLEIPSNPRLETPDLTRLQQIMPANIPWVLDDTIGFGNIDDGKLPDNVAFRVTSLTKQFSSVGNVMGGAIILRPQNPNYARLREIMEKRSLPEIWWQDAQVLARNSSYFNDVLPLMNRNGHMLAHHMLNNYADAFNAIHYPSLDGHRETYDQFRKVDGGYGSLVSFDFKDPEVARRFSEAFRVTPAPGLGYFYSTQCWYTRLAHKNAMEQARYGVPVDLLRISTGIEGDREISLTQRSDEAMEIALAG